MISEPGYLVQTADLCLHAYWHLENLLIDLSIRRNECVTLYRVSPGRRTTVTYCPVTIDELRAEYEQSKVRVS